MIDDKLTASIQQWVQCPPSERNVAEGATLLLKLNRNQFLYRNACLFPSRYDGIVENELRKHLRIRLDGLTQREVALMERTLVPAVAADIDAGAPVVDADAERPSACHRGIRPDHDCLPDGIRALYEQNGDIYFRMKQLFVTLQGMADKQPCDRYELLRQLRDLDDRYRANWLRYDSYDNYAPAEPADAGSAADVAKALSAARKFVSDGLKKIDAATGAETRAERIAAIQERVAFIASQGGTFKPDFQARLEAAGVKF